MAQRKQFQTQLSVSPELMNLLQEARKREITEEELQEQRVSFAYGNAPETNLITRESVQSTSMHIRLLSR